MPASSSIWSSNSTNNGLITSNMFNSLQQTLISENVASTNRSASFSSSSSTSSSSSSSSSSSLEHVAIQQNYLANNGGQLTPSSFLFLNDSTSPNSSTNGYYDFGIMSNLNENPNHELTSQILNKNDPFMSIGFGSPLIAPFSQYAAHHQNTYSSGGSSCNTSTVSSAASSHNDIILNSIFQHEQHLATNGKFNLNDLSPSSQNLHNFNHNPIHELSNFYYSQNQPNNVDAHAN